MRALPFVVAALLAASCAPRDARVRLERVAAERRNLEATLDQLEERLLADQARVRFWREMQQRHESVSAIACASQQRHAAEMAVHALPKARSPLHRARVAAATPAADPPPARAPARK